MQMKSDSNNAGGAGVPGGGDVGRQIEVSRLAGCVSLLVDFLFSLLFVLILSLCSLLSPCKVQPLPGYGIGGQERGSREPAAWRVRACSGWSQRNGSADVRPEVSRNMYGSCIDHVRDGVFNVYV